MENKITLEAYEYILDSIFELTFNANDLFAPAAWGVTVAKEDLQWMLPIITKWGQDGIYACISYIQNTPIMDKYMTEQVQIVLDELVKRKQVVEGDFDFREYYTQQGPYRRVMTDRDFINLIQE